MRDFAVTPCNKIVANCLRSVRSPAYRPLPPAARSGCAPLRYGSDVLVHAQDIVAVPPGLDGREPLVVGTVRSADAVVALVRGQEVDVRATGREAPQVAPGGARPLDMLCVLRRVLPGRCNAEHVRGVAVADGGIIGRQPIEHALHVE